MFEKDGFHGIFSDEQLLYVAFVFVYSEIFNPKVWPVLLSFAIVVSGS